MSKYQFKKVLQQPDRWQKRGVMLFTTATLQHSKTGYHSTECWTTAVWKTLVVAGHGSTRPRAKERRRELREMNEWKKGGGGG